MLRQYSTCAESLLNLSGIRAQFRRFGCAIFAAYAFILQEACHERRVWHANAPSPFSGRRGAFSGFIAKRLDFREILDGANHLAGVAVLVQRAFGPLLKPSNPVKSRLSAIAHSLVKGCSPATDYAPKSPWLFSFTWRKNLFIFWPSAFNFVQLLTTFYIFH